MSISAVIILPPPHHPSSILYSYLPIPPPVLRPSVPPPLTPSNAEIEEETVRLMFIANSAIDLLERGKGRRFDESVQGCWSSTYNNNNGDNETSNTTKNNVTSNTSSPSRPQQTQSKPVQFYTPPNSHHSYPSTLHPYQVHTYVPPSNITIIIITSQASLSQYQQTSPLLTIDMDQPKFNPNLVNVNSSSNSAGTGNSMTNVNDKYNNEIKSLCIKIHRLYTGVLNLNVFFDVTGVSNYNACSSSNNTNEKTASSSKALLNQVEQSYYLKPTQLKLLPDSSTVFMKSSKFDYGIVGMVNDFNVYVLSG